jgi:hypothetical protein
MRWSERSTVTGKFHDLLDRTDSYKAGEHGFFLDVGSWRKFTSSAALTWQRVKFWPSAKASIPTERGIYVFTIEVEGLSLPPHGYILYIGITGNTSAANLRTRYGQYLRNLIKEDGRPRVFYMLKRWRDDLVFNFVPVADTAVDLAEIEKSFINAVRPPVNEADFDADIADPKKAKF